MVVGIGVVFPRPWVFRLTYRIELSASAIFLLQSLETDLLVEHITRLKAGEAVDIPTYNFCTHTRENATVRQEPRPVILVEGKFCDHGVTFGVCSRRTSGQRLLNSCLLACLLPRRTSLGILLFSDESLVSQFDLRVFVDAPSDIRLMRRIRRDCEERDRTVNSVLEQYTSTVRPMHETYVEPSKAHAHLIVPTTGKDQSSPQEQLRIAVQVLSNHVRTLANLPP